MAPDPQDVLRPHIGGRTNEQITVMNPVWRHGASAEIPISASYHGKMRDIERGQEHISRTSEEAEKIVTQLV